MATPSAAWQVASGGERVRDWVRQAERVDMDLALTAAACDLVRLLKLLAEPVLA